MARHYDAESFSLARSAVEFLASPRNAGITERRTLQSASLPRHYYRDCARLLEGTQAMQNVLVVGGLHVAALLVGCRPKLCLEPEIGAFVVRLFRHQIL